MPKTPIHLKKGLKFETPAVFRIIVQGNLDASWSEQLGGMEISSARTLDNQPLTILTGRLIDQAALAGVLHSLYEMHLPLIKVELLEEE